MPRRTTIAAATLVLAALLFMGVGPAAFASSDQPPRSGGSIVVVLAPYLTWQDVLSGDMPAVRGLAERGVVADTNVRSGAAGSGDPSAARGALMLGAGASTSFEPTALGAYDASDTVDGTSARDLYAQVYGRAPGTARVLYLGAAQQSAVNAQTGLDGRVGSLAEALRAAGVRTAAIGNSDLGRDALPDARSRPAAMAAADGSGTVDLGTVSADLLVDDPTAPFGVRGDPDRLLAAFDEARAGRARFLVVDSGDLERADAF
ncbi:MAG TPA: hypothetical protein VF902_06035, partial [Coriobacteriia bacterium]